MSVTIQDATTADLLGRRVGIEIEVFGPDGRLLGRFTPAPRPGVSFPEIGMSDEELTRVKDDPNGWASVDEVNALLRRLRGSK